jgi:hypothetical protein
LIIVTAVIGRLANWFLRLFVLGWELPRLTVSAPAQFKRAQDNFLPARVMTIETAAMTQHIFTRVGWGHEAFGSLVDAPERLRPAGLRKRRMSL